MQPSHSNLSTPDRGLDRPIQPRRPKLPAQLSQALLGPPHYRRRDESLDPTRGLPASGTRRDPGSRSNGVLYRQENETPHPMRVNLIIVMHKIQRYDGIN